MRPHLPLCGAVLALSAVLASGQPAQAQEPSADSTPTTTMPGDTSLPGSTATTVGDGAGTGEVADVACDSAGYLWSYIMDVSELEAGGDPQVFHDSDSGLEVQVSLDSESAPDEASEAEDGDDASTDGESTDSEAEGDESTGGESGDSADEGDVAEAPSINFTASQEVAAATLHTPDSLRTYTFNPAIASAGALTPGDEAAGSLTSLTLCWGEDPDNPVDTGELPRTGWGTPMVIALAVALGAIGIMLGLSSRLLSFPGARRR